MTSSRRSRRGAGFEFCIAILSSTDGFPFCAQKRAEQAFLWFYAAPYRVLPRPPFEDVSGIAPNSRDAHLVKPMSFWVPRGPPARVCTSFLAYVIAAPCSCPDDSSRCHNE